MARPRSAARRLLVALDLGLGNGVCFELSDTVFERCDLLSDDVSELRYKIHFAIVEFESLRLPVALSWPWPWP